MFQRLGSWDAAQDSGLTPPHSEIIGSPNLGAIAKGSVTITTESIVQTVQQHSLA